MDTLRDIKPPLPLEGFPHWPAWVWLAAGLGLLALAGLGLAALRRRRRGAPARRARRLLSRDLRHLTREADALDPRDFAYRFADLARRVLALRTGLAAQAMTTGELLPGLETCDLRPDLVRALAEALGRTDPARYAPPDQAPASHASRRADLDLLRRLLDRGRPC